MTSVVGLWSASLTGSVRGAAPPYKAAGGVVCAVYLLTLASPWLRDFMLLQPGGVIPPWVKLWKLLTAGCTEVSLSGLVSSLLGLVWASGMLDQAWGSREVARFAAIVSVCASAATALTLILAYIVTSDLSLLFTGFGGGVACLTGLLVAHKQLYPSRVWKIDGPWGTAVVEARLLPTLYVAIYGLFWLLGLNRGSTFILAAWGQIVSFAYLRFFQPRGSGKGDASDAFVFPDMFPRAVQPVMARGGKVLFRALQGLKLCPSKAQRATASALPVVMPGVAPQDAERRRQKALRDLDNRLSGISSAGTTINPVATTSAAAAPSAASTLSDTANTAALAATTVSMLVDANKAIEAPLSAELATAKAHNTAAAVAP